MTFIVRYLIIEELHLGGAEAKKTIRLVVNYTKLRRRLYKIGRPPDAEVLR